MFLKRSLILTARNFRSKAFPQRQNPGFIHVAGFSTEESDPKATAVSKPQKSANYRNLVIGSASAAALGVSYLLYDITYEFLSLTPAASLYYGYLAGVLSTAAAGGVGYIGVRWSRMNPDRAISAAMKVVRKNPKAMALLGDGISSGYLRTYSVHRGGVTFKNGLPALTRPEIQLSFIAKGSNNEAVVTVVYSVFGLRERVVYCGLNWPVNGKGEQMISTAIVGDKDSFTAQADIKKHGSILSFLN